MKCACAKLSSARLYHIFPRYFTYVNWCTDNSMSEEADISVFREDHLDRLDDLKDSEFIQD